MVFNISGEVNHNDSIYAYIAVIPLSYVEFIMQNCWCFGVINLA